MLNTQQILNRHLIGHHSTNIFTTIIYEQKGVDHYVIVGQRSNIEQVSVILLIIFGKVMTEHALTVD